MSSRSTAPTLWGLAAAALFGASTPLSKTLLGSVGPLCLAGLLYLGAAGAVLPFARRGAAVDWEPLNLWRLAGAVFCGGILAPVLLLAGLSLAPAGSVALWLTLEAPATALLAYALFKEHLDRRVWVAVALVVLASVLLAAPDGFGTAPAAALVALACVCWGLDNNLTALIDRLTPAQTTVAKGLVAGTINLTLGLWIGNGLPDASVAAAGLLVGGVSYGLSLVLYINAAQHLGAARSQLLFATAPVWGVALAWTALSEPLSAAHLLAGGLMLTALGLLSTERHAHEHTHAALTHTHRHRHDDGYHDHVHPDRPAWFWHSHEHAHTAVAHTHAHRPDLHHRHGH